MKHRIETPKSHTCACKSLPPDQVLSAMPISFFSLPEFRWPPHYVVLFGEGSKLDKFFHNYLDCSSSLQICIGMGVTNTSACNYDGRETVKVGLQLLPSDGAIVVLLMKRSVEMHKGLPILGVFR